MFRKSRIDLWRGVFVSILIAFAAAPALAGQAVVTWTQPTKLADGSPTPASGPGAITAYRVEYILGPSGCATWPTGTSTSQSYGPTVLSATITGLGFGTWCFRAYASNSGGESVPSNIAPDTIAVPPPGPPGDGTIHVADLTIYDIVKQPGKLVMLAVGTVPAGTQCDTTQTVNGLYAVPTDAAHWFGNVRPVIVFAQCS